MVTSRTRTTRPTPPPRAAGVNVRAPESAAVAGWQSRRGVVIAVAVLTMLVVAGLLLLILQMLPKAAQLFPVERVQFVSATAEPLKEVSDDALQQVANAMQTRRVSMVDVDIASLRNLVKEIMWVRDAGVRRALPNRIVVSIEEHKPLAQWRRTDDIAVTDASATQSVSAEPSATQLVNSYGEVFQATISDERRQLLPVVAGPAGTSAEVMTKFASLVTPLAGVGRAPSTLELTPRRAWRLTLENGAVLELGRGEIEPRLARFINAYPQIAALQVTKARVDLRYPSGIAVSGSTPAAASGAATANRQQKT
jgi:cell division protein FtsQ